MNSPQLTRWFLLLAGAALPAGVGAQVRPITQAGTYPPGTYSFPCRLTRAAGGNEVTLVSTALLPAFPGIGEIPPQCNPIILLIPGTYKVIVKTAHVFYGRYEVREAEFEITISASAPQEEKPSCATVTFVRGPVVVIGQGRERPVEEGDTVPGGEEIAVKSSPVGGELGPVAQVELADGSILRLGPGTRLRCDEANYEPESKSLSFRARLLAGQIWAEVQNAFCKVADCVYVYDDWGGAIGIRGTSFTVEVRKPWMQVRVYASEKSVAFLRNTCGPVKKEVVVRAGYESVVDGCNPPTEPRKFTAPAHPWWEIER